MKHLVKRFLMGLTLLATPAMAQETTELHVRGSYNVPVPAELRDAASWDTNYCLHYDADGKLVAIGYALPDFLAPEDQRHITLTNPRQTSNGFLEFQDETGLASCSVRSDRLVCLVSYPLIDYDFEDHIRNLLTRYDAATVESHKGVVDIFAHDPEGVIEIYGFEAP